MFRPVLIAALCAAALAAASPRAAPVLPPGTRITCRVDQSFDNDRDAPGTPFTGQTTADIVYKGAVLVPRGAACRGRLTGRSELQLSLESIQVQGRVYPVTASAPLTGEKSHRKHNVQWFGGGRSAGSAIGLVAGGGIVGALIGAGAAANAEGTTLKGKCDVYLPPQSLVTFRLRQQLRLSR